MIIAMHKIAACILLNYRAIDRLSNESQRYFYYKTVKYPAQSIFIG